MKRESLWLCLRRLAGLSPDGEIEVEQTNNTNSSEDKNGAKGRRRKSFHEGLCEKTLSNRFSALDLAVNSGMLLLLLFVICNFIGFLLVFIGFLLVFYWFLYWVLLEFHS
jgi:hypothetical protein